jgi:hypothetical protein
MSECAPAGPTVGSATVPPPAFETIASAARRLGVDAVRLRERCLRNGERVGECIVALLDDGVVAFKFGGRWRVRFPRTAPAPTASPVEHE